jgi:hypothetical protein
MKFDVGPACPRPAQGWMATHELVEQAVARSGIA